MRAGKAHSSHPELLLFLCVSGFLAYSWPLITSWEVDEIGTVYLHLFVVWSILVLVLALCTLRRDTDMDVEDPSPKESHPED